MGRHTLRHGKGYEKQVGTANTLLAPTDINPLQYRRSVQIPEVRIPPLPELHITEPMRIIRAEGW